MFDHINQRLFRKILYSKVMPMMALARTGRWSLTPQTIRWQTVNGLDALRGKIWMQFTNW